MRARSARSAVPAIVVAVALATGGLAYGSSAERDPNSTAGAQTAKAAPPGAAPVGGTATMQAKQGVKPSKTVSKGSTRDTRAPVNRSPQKATKVRSNDRGVKDVRATKDRGKRNAPATRDLGAR